MPNRFFPATVMGGRLHVLAEGRPWDSNSLDWWREDELDLILASGSYGVKVRTMEELEIVLRAPIGVAPTRRVWIHEAFEGDVRRMWEAEKPEGTGRVCRML